MAARRGRPATRGSGPSFVPGPPPEFGQCVHKLVIAADGTERLYQQNHCGVYRSADGGRDWTEVTTGLPSEFGFPMAAHPRDPLTVWTIPLNGAELGRFVPDGSAAVWRTNDGGDSWIRSGDGLPQRDAFIGVLPRGDGGRPARPGRRLLRDEHGPALRQRRRGAVVAAHRREPAADLVGRHHGARLTATEAGGPAGDPAGADAPLGEHDPAASPSPRLPTVTVVLPRSLMALLPGAPRRSDATGRTVAELIDDLDRRIPGLRDRLLRRSVAAPSHQRLRRG